MKTLLLAFVLLLGVPTLASAQSLVVPSLWKNEFHSTLEFKWATPSWDGKGARFGGTFINHAKSYKCKGIPYYAHGHTHGSKIVFEVRFSACDTVTIWTGYFRHHKIYAPWSLTYWVNGQPNYLKGVDVFWRVH